MPTKRELGKASAISSVEMAVAAADVGDQGAGLARAGKLGGVQDLDHKMGRLAT